MAEAVERQTILVVGVVPSDGVRLDRILLGSSWQSHVVGTCQQALDFLDRHHVSVVLSEPQLSDGNWRELLNGMASLAAPPKLIVSSRLADDRLWAEVLNLGGFDVLMMPFDAEEVLQVTSSARSEWGSKQLGGLARAASASSPEFR